MRQFPMKVTKFPDEFDLCRLCIDARYAFNISQKQSIPFQNFQTTHFTYEALLNGGIEDELHVLTNGVITING